MPSYRNELCEAEEGFFHKERQLQKATSFAWSYCFETRRPYIMSFFKDEPKTSVQWRPMVARPWPVIEPESFGKIAADLPPFAPPLHRLA